jgi:hypothetical protein
MTDKRMNQVDLRVQNGLRNIGRAVELGQAFSDAVLYCASMEITTLLLGPNWDRDTDVDVGVSQIIERVVFATEEEARAEYWRALTADGRPS